MMRDPVCLMDVGLRAAGAMAVHQGRAWYFCSDGCKQMFTADPGKYLGNASAERLTVGVMGSADTDSDPAVVRRARTLGEAVADNGLILVTGACPGLPHECARGARDHNGLSVGISPALSLDEHIHKYLSPTDAFDILIYTGSGLMGREVTNIRSSDMVVIMGGRSGTLGEFAIAYDEGKLIGVLEGSGGITRELPNLIQHIEKDTGALLVYESDPATLIDRLLKDYTERHYRQPSCFCSDISSQEEQE